MSVNKVSPTATSALLKATQGKLIYFEDLPLPWRVNQYIHSGYRFRHTFHGCIRSIFSLSNESFNIWSHLLGLYLVFAQWMDTEQRLTARLEYHERTAADKLVHTSFTVASVIALLCSVSWHTMCCHSQEWVFDAFDTADLMGITVLVSVASLMLDYTLFYCDEFWRRFYCSLTGILALGAIVSMATPTLRHPDMSWLRVSFFLGIGFSSVAPVIQLTCTLGFSRTLSWYWPMMEVWVPILIGAVAYGTKTPESIWPGKFDYIGSSHNIWHVTSLVAILNGHSVMERLYMGAVEGAPGMCKAVG
jgi:adiponectin receptor